MREDTDQVIKKATECKENGETDEALAYLSQACEGEKCNTRQLIEIAGTYHALDHTERAIEILNSGLKDHANDPRLLRELGNFQKISGDIGSAENSLQQAVAGNPDDAKSHQSYINLFLYSGKPDKAIAACRDAIEHLPGNVQIWQTFSSLMYSTGNVKEYARSCRELYKLQDKSPISAVTLAEALIMTGESEAAEAVLRESASIHHSDVLLHKKLIMHLLRNRKYNAAIEACNQAIHGFHNHEIELLKAHIQEQTGDFDAAFESLLPLIDTPDVKMDAALKFALISPYLGTAGEAKRIISFIMEREGISDVPANVAEAISWLDQNL